MIAHTQQSVGRATALLPVGLAQCKLHIVAGVSLMAHQMLEGLVGVCRVNVDDDPEVIIVTAGGVTASRFHLAGIERLRQRQKPGSFFPCLRHQLQHGILHLIGRDNILLHPLGSVVHQAACIAGLAEELFQLLAALLQVLLTDRGTVCMEEHPHLVRQPGQFSQTISAEAIQRDTGLQKVQAAVRLRQEKALFCQFCQSGARLLIAFKFSHLLPAHVNDHQPIGRIIIAVQSAIQPIDAHGNTCQLLAEAKALVAKLCHFEHCNSSLLYASAIDCPQLRLG